MFSYRGKGVRGVVETRDVEGVEAAPNGQRRGIEAPRGWGLRGGPLSSGGGVYRTVPPPLRNFWGLNVDMMHFGAFIQDTLHAQ